MAQLNIRISDDKKEAAEKVAREAGFSLGEYLLTIVSYMSDHHKLPIVIEFKPMAVKPDEVFQQAITKFRYAYLQVSSLLDGVLKEGEMTPLSFFSQPLRDIQNAENFYNTFKGQIVLAKGQLEKISMPQEEERFFACSQEHFPPILGFLRLAMRCVHFNNREIQLQDLDEMKSALEGAAKHINVLQRMVEGNVSSEAREAFFVFDVKQAIEFASRATMPKGAYTICSAFRDRMNTHIQQAKLEFQALGVVPNLNELMVIHDKLLAIGEAVNDYLEGLSIHMKHIDSPGIDGLDHSEINKLKERVSDWIGERCSTKE